jgi:hypothetical protein
MTIQKMTASRKVFFPWFYNVTAPQKGHRGSLNHKFKWNLFDQIVGEQEFEQ